MHVFRRAYLSAAAAATLLFAQATFADVFTPTGALHMPRYGAFAAPLPGGKVLIAGGFNGSSLASGEIFDSATGTFTPISNNLSAARGFGTATVLQDGRVLLAGGGAYDDSADLATADIFDPSTGTFAPTGSMHTARASMTATLLPSGKVLIAGGISSDKVTRIASAELYDPATGTWSPTGSMTTGRDDAIAVLLNNGKVLVASGGNMDLSVGTADIYDPATGTFTASQSTFPPRDFASAVKLSSGEVLLIGGRIDSNNANTGSLNTVVKYNPVTDTFGNTASMASARFYFPAVLLSNGNVLVAGGYNDAGVVEGAEIFSVNDVIFANGFEGP